MATPNPISGVTPMNIGSTVLFTDSTLGGVWSSSDTGKATVDGAGNVTAVAQGTCQIVYTVGASSTAFQLIVNPAQSISNGMNVTQITEALQNRVLFRSQGLVSDSGRYYEGFHPLNDTALLDAVRPDDGTSLSTYLSSLQSAVLMECVTEIFNRPQAIDRAKLVFWKGQTTVPYQYVANTGQFVGLRIYVCKGEFGVKLNSVQLFFNMDATFNLYLYNDLIDQPLYITSVTCHAYIVTTINLGESIILNNLVPEQYKNGWFYLGYYQADLPAGAQAIYYPVSYNVFKPCMVMAFSTNVIDSPAGTGRNWNRVTVGANNLMYGMNLEISTFIDNTNSIVQNAHLLDNPMGLLMAIKVIEQMIFNYQTGSKQRAINGIPELAKLYAELNGYQASENSPYIVGLRSKYLKALKTAKAGLQDVEELSIGTA